ncbi:MAG TPA: HAD-IA family hydrolase, partial [Gemmatimonadaceae bacterium]|nr:HAD-IA family hydrolase [Gemmatimonadaceae bacterium]
TRLFPADSPLDRRRPLVFGMTQSRPWAVLFDLDGTLVDSIELLLMCARHTFEGRERRPTDDEWIAGLGTPLPTQMRAYVDTDEEVEQLRSRYRAFQRENHDLFMREYPGVEDTLIELERRGHPMGVVTSKSNEMMDRGLRYLRLDRFMKTSIGHDSCQIHKPDPFPVRLALQELGYEPNEAVFVGDSPHDIASGNAARVVSIAALWGPFTRAQLDPHKPKYFLERITDLPALLDRLQ